MFLPVVAGSDKTTVSVATGHQEYHPVYMSPGNFTNIARRAQGNAVLPVAFLPIPKSMCFYIFWCVLPRPYLLTQRQKNTGKR
jgi:Plavaka transposase